MSNGPEVPIGYVPIASGISGGEAERFDRQARQITPLRYVLITTEAGPRGWLDAYVDIWAHPDDVPTAKQLLNSSE